MHKQLNKTNSYLIVSMNSLIIVTICLRWTKKTWCAGRQL